MDSLLRQIQERRSTIVAEIGALSPSDQRWREQEASWSALDILEHLVLAESVVLGDLSTALERTHQSPTLPERVKSAIVWMVLRFGIRARVPARAMKPTGQGAFDELRERWDAKHEQLRAFASRLEGAAVQRRVFRHPIAGPMHTEQALRLMYAHMGTHQRQLARLKQSLAARTAARSAI